LLIAVFILIITAGLFGRKNRQSKNNKLKYKGERKGKYVVESKGKSFCLHNWSKPKIRINWDSNVIEYEYRCKKCGKIKREIKPR